MAENLVGYARKDLSALVKIAENHVWYARKLRPDGREGFHRRQVPSAMQTFSLRMSYSTAEFNVF